ncbi:SH3 domain-containing protein [Celeribacter sp.]|uniref:SH3 domain-containing protein n=1 Tax=Celeribacter sp. TaxID=1890673 RepID=UPI003A93E911
MLRLTFWTVIGLFSALYLFGGELSPEEQAELDARRAAREPVLAMLQNAFNDNSKRKGAYVPVLADLNDAPSTNVPDIQVASNAPLQPRTQTPALMQVSYSQEANTDLFQTPTHATTSATDPAKLAALVAADQADDQNDDDMILRVVTAKRVNVRSGPSTSNEVLGQVVQADIVRLLSSPYAEWVKISVEGAGVEGYMAARFLDELSD